MFSARGFQQKISKSVKLLPLKKSELKLIEIANFEKKGLRSNTEDINSNIVNGKICRCM